MIFPMTDEYLVNECNSKAFFEEIKFDKFKTFEEVKEYLNKGLKLKYYFNGDDEYGNVILKQNKIFVDVPYNGWEDIEESIQEIIDDHNIEFEEHPNMWHESIADIYAKKWKSWKDIPDSNFHYVPENFYPLFI